MVLQLYITVTYSEENMFMSSDLFQMLMQRHISVIPDPNPPMGL